jgi:hypothetical protein
MRSSFVHLWSRHLVVAAVGAIAVAVSPAEAQQQVPANGIAFSAEAGPQGKQSLFTIQSAKGVMTGASIRIIEGARVPSVTRTAGHHVGTLTLDSLEHPLTLTIPARSQASGALTLLRHGTLRVTFSPKAKRVLAMSGLPAMTTRVQLKLNGGKGQLLTSQGCADEQNFTVAVSRAREKAPLHGKAGVTC